MSQTSYTLDHAVAYAGQIADVWLGTDVSSYPAGEVIPPGRMCEVVAGVARLAQSTGDGSADNLIGVSIYKAMAVPGGYQIGDMVPCLRKGRIWVDFVGTGATELEAARYKHASVTATDRGKFTDAAAASGADAEVSGVVGVFRNRPAGPGGSPAIACVDLVLPSRT